MIYGTGQGPQLTTVWLSAFCASRYKRNWWRKLDSYTGLRFVCRRMGPVTSFFSPLSQKLTKIQQKKSKWNGSSFLHEMWGYLSGEYSSYGPYSSKQRAHVSPKCWYLTTKLHDVTSQEIVMLNQPLHQATKAYRRVEVNAPTVFIPVETNDSHYSYVILNLIFRSPNKSSRTNINLICVLIIECGPLQGSKDLAN